MSSRHHIDDFMRGRIIGKIEEGRKITDVARSSTSLTALFHGCGSHLKLLECVCSRRHGGGRVRSTRRLQKTDISSYQQKGTGAPQLSRWQISFLLPQESRSPENCCQTFEGRRTIRTQTCCVCPIDQTAPYCPFAMVS
ncbi:hypothetical protein TNCV_3881031 [Trichonephila clavipes]|nr:hypothetical protein TNCV_3881031 [Trichonephila clavipes]